MPTTINIIGAGHVGQTLGRLWASGQSVQIQDILNRTPTSSAAARDFIGAGQAAASLADLRPADITLLAVPDDRIATVCSALAEAGKLSPSSIVFHCSGALSSAALDSAQQHGAASASVHPIRSFAMPEQVVASFAGTRCGVEGHPRALAALETCFNSIGARFVPIKAEQKVLYHAAAVFACNYLVTLQDLAQACYVEAGVAPATALELLEPLVRETVDNIFRHGPLQALTGPIARGDMATVARQQNALNIWNPEYGALYEHFTRLTSELAARKLAMADAGKAS